MPHATPSMAPTTTSLTKWTPAKTRKIAKQTPSASTTQPMAGLGQQAQNVTPIINIENACLLGNDFPFVSLLIAGLISSIS